MFHIFEIIDKSGRRIRLTKERWRHINQRHNDVPPIDYIQLTLQHPDKISRKFSDEYTNYYHKYFKEKKAYVFVSVKYLNGKGYIITVYYSKKIK